MKNSLLIILIVVLAVSLTGIGAFCQPEDIPPEFLETQSLPEADIADDTKSSTPEEKPPENENPEIISIEIVDTYGFNWKVIDNIISIIAPAVRGEPLQVYEFNVDAIDPDGDILEYSWDIQEIGCAECNNLGTFSHPNQPMTTWTTTENPGFYPIIATVTDEKGGEDSESFIMEVFESSEEQIIELEPTLEESGMIEIGENFFYGSPLLIGDSDYNNPTVALVIFDMTPLIGSAVNTATLTLDLYDHYGDLSFLGDEIHVSTIKTKYFTPNISTFYLLDLMFESGEFSVQDVFNMDESLSIPLEDLLDDGKIILDDLDEIIGSLKLYLQGAIIPEEFVSLPLLIYSDDMLSDNNDEWNGVMLKPKVELTPLVVLHHEIIGDDDERAYYGIKEGQTSWFSNVGLVFTLDEEGNTIVKEVVPGGSAEDVGIKEGDQIIKVHGIIDVEGLPIYDVVNMLDGAHGTEVNVTFLQAGEVSLMRIIPGYGVPEAATTGESTQTESAVIEGNEEIGGIGTFLFQDEEGNIIIDELVPGGSAEDAGIKEGDQIIKVDGIDIDGMDLNTVADMIIGPVGSEVIVTFLQAGEVTLLRGILPEEGEE